MGFTRSKKIPNQVINVQDKSTRSQLKQFNMNSDPNWFEEVFKCYICLSNLVQPNLCPKCSKLCCEGCIKKWLREQKEECPHCRANIDQSQLVPCRFLDEIQEHLKNAMTSTTEDIDNCAEHQTQINYYCHTCEIPICSDCGMFGDKHKDHKFERIDSIYSKRIEGIHVYLTALRKRMSKFNKKVKEIDKKVNHCNVAKLEADRDLVNLINKYKFNLEQQLRNKHEVLFSQRNILVKQFNFLTTTIENLDMIVTSKSKVKVLQSDDQVIQLLKKVEEVIVKNPGDDINVDMTFEKDFLPEFDTYKFQIPPKYFDFNNDTTYESDVISEGGLKWKLEACLIGSSTSKTTKYVSLKVILVSGSPKVSRYSIRIEMKHPNRSDSIIREFNFDLKIGDSKGFRQFCRLSSLSSKGFKHDQDDCFVVSCGIRPLSYRQKCLNQQAYIEELEEKLKTFNSNSLDQNTEQTEDSSVQHSPYKPIKVVPLKSPIPEFKNSVEYLNGEVSEHSNSKSIRIPQRTNQASNAQLTRSKELHNFEDYNIGSSQSNSLDNSTRISPLLDTFKNKAPQRLHYLRRPTKTTVSRVESTGFILPTQNNSNNRRESRERSQSFNISRFLKNKDHEQSSDSEFEDEFNSYTAIPSFTNTDELRQLIHLEFDNLANLNPTLSSRTRLPHPINSDQQSRRNSQVVINDRIAAQEELPLTPISPESTEYSPNTTSPNKLLFLSSSDQNLQSLPVQNRHRSLSAGNCFFNTCSLNSNTKTSSNLVDPNEEYESMSSDEY